MTTVGRRLRRKEWAESSEHWACFLKGQTTNKTTREERDMMEAKK